MIAHRLALGGLAALLAVAALAAAVPAVVAAQGDGGAEATKTATTGSQPAGDADDQGDDALVALGVLVFGALALGMTLLYLNAWRRSSEKLIEQTLSATGQLPEYEVVAAALPDAGARGIEPKIVRLSLRGPALVHVGRGARFRAFADGEPIEVDWAVQPPDAGRAAPATGEWTTMTPARLGPLTVQASAAGTTAEAHTVAVAAPQRAGAIPLVGVGYGGITIAIFALTLAAAATAYGKLDGAALVALGGAVVGYFFVEASASGQRAGTSGETGTSAAAGDGRGALGIGDSGADGEGP